ncbi:hypothetical protein MBRU_04235 [Mycolicibacterium brumae DSM 44177]|nr:hypothetical protein MBRU_04235 [Mycolicibacterium brumae DSM 44177]
MAVLLAFTVVGCGRDKPADGSESERAAAAEEFAQQLHGDVTLDAMMSHLWYLQDIADRKGGNRAIGSPGYDASVDYVATQLREAGFEVRTPEFEVRLPKSEPGTVRAGDASFVAHALNFSTGTTPDGVTGDLLVLPIEDDSPGCADDDYAGLDATGAVVLVNRGKCPFADKLAVATKAGAAAVVVADTTDEKQMGGTIGENSEVKTPIVSVTKADGAALREHPGPVTLTVEASVQEIAVRNVIAQTETGSSSDVVMVGAHLDSVPEGPGINDNGSGVAAVLETAKKLGPKPEIANAVRFAFWGAEEVGLVGSQKYIETLDEAELRDIALYLNFDMVGSPNPGYFTIDGDQSTTIPRNQPVPRVPEGSAGIERLLSGYLRGQGKESRDTSFDGRSDYDAFTFAGIPSGGLFSGAEGEMTREEAELWEGQAGQPYDPNYHKDSDTLEHINKTAMDIQGRGVAYAVGYYAQDLGGRNGVPAREDRTRHVVPPS